ncbi:MAG: cupin domain-containing protein [Chitinophagales bacterium]|nr:cupin domain-containing protein [Chitinophagales bacterium]
MSPIIKADSKSEYYFEERCYITELLNNSSEPDLSVARARVEPGVTTALHRVLGTAEKYYILSGTGAMEVDGQAAGTVNPGDMVLIPPGQTQRITNTGSADLIFLCFCTPRFEPKNYEAVQES